MDDRDNPHRTLTKWCAQRYYKSNACCGVKDDPDRVELSPNGESYPSLAFELPRQRHELDKVSSLTLAFELPRQRHELDKVSSLMERAYNRGVADNRSAIGALLRELIKF